MFAVLGKLGWFFKEHRRRYTVAVGLLIIAGILEIIPPKIIGNAIDLIYQGTLSWHSLTQILLLIGGTALVNYLITYFWMYKLFGGSFLVERTLRSRFMGHLLRMTPTFFERNRTGDLMARATNDLHAVSNTVGFGILMLIDSTLFLTTILLTMGILISWKLTFAALLPLPIIAVIISVFGRIIHRRFTIAQDSFGDMNDQVLESIAGVRVTRAYVQEEAEERRFHSLTEEVYHKNMAVTVIDALFEPTIKICVGLSYLIGIGYGAYLVFQQQITLGNLITFNVYLGMMIWPMFAIGEMINLMQRGNASIDRVNEILSYKPDVEDAVGTAGEAGEVEAERTAYARAADGAHEAASARSNDDRSDTTAVSSTPGRITFRNYSFRYPSAEADNLRDFNLTLKRGQTLGIVGRTGSGKTTLIKQLLREYPIGHGDIIVEQRPLELNAFPGTQHSVEPVALADAQHSVAPHALAGPQHPVESHALAGKQSRLEQIDLDILHSWIGYVPQDSMLFSKTVRDNIKFGRRDASEQEVQQALELAAFGKDINVLAEGLDTLVGEKGVALSGGQKQRVSIARALIADPEVLLLDDALSAVDAKTEAQIIRNVRSTREGRTTIITTHRLSAVQHADWIIVLDSGRLTEEGTHEQLLKLNGWYKEQYDRQQAEEDLTS